MKDFFAFFVTRFRSHRVSLIIVIIFSMVSTLLPSTFARAMTSDTYWRGGLYPQSLIDNGSTSAGRKASDAEYVFHPTSNWTTLAMDLESGNFLFHAHLLSIQGISLSIPFFLTYNSMNAGEDIGLGKGWLSNLHSCVSEDDQTHDITYISPTGAKLVFSYDSQSQSWDNPTGFTGSLTKNISNEYIVTSLEGITQTFDSDGKLIHVSPRDGIGYTIAYTTGRPSSVTDDLHANRTYSLTWNGTGKLTSLTDGLSQSWSFSYDANENKLESITQPGQSAPSCSFGYDANDRMTSHEDFEGFTYDIAYEASSPYRITSWQQPSDEQTSFSYTSASSPYSKKTTVTNPESIAVHYYFATASGRLEKVEQTVGIETLQRLFAYNALGLVSSITDSLGNTQSFTYDTVGHCTQQTDPTPSQGMASYVQEWTYSPSNDVEGLVTQYREKVTSDLWNLTSFQYNDQDAPSKPSAITNALSQTTQFNYNANGQMTSITQPTTTGTKTRTFTYNPSSGSLTKSTDFDSNETTYSWNHNGFVTQSIQYEGNETTGTPLHAISYTYSTTNQQTATSDSVTSQSSSNVIASSGAITQSTNLTGCQTSYEYEYEMSSVDYKMPKPDILLSPAHASPFPVAVQSNALHSLSYLSMPSYQPTPYVVTNAMDQDTTTSYNDDGSVSSQTSYLGDTTQFTYDSAGRLSTATTQDGQQTTLLYTLNSLRSSVAVESQGMTSYTYDNRSQCTSKTDPIQGTLSYTYNTRGDKLTDEQGTYSYDLLGRKTALSYTGGGSDSWSYTPDGFLSSASGIARTYDDQGNVLTWNDGTNSATYDYAGGSSSVGLPSSCNAQGQSSSYIYTYNTTHWLYTLNNTSKPSQGNFTYSWSTAKELTSISNPNSTQLSQTYTNKQLDHVQVQDSLGQTTYLSSDATYNAQDQMTAYDYTVSASPSNFTTSTSIAYHTSGSNLGKVNTLTDANRTITYGYNAQDGLVSSVQFSTLGTYSFSRNSNGTMDTITYPNQQGTASFSYSGGLGKLSQIALPGNQTISLGWNGKSQVSTVTGNNNGSSTAYSLTYNGSGQITYMAKSSGGMQQYYWHMDYGPHGLEKARQYSPYDVLLLTQDFTTDPTGRILSMTYTDANPTYQYNGEYYFHYDHVGNMCLLTDSSGNPAYSIEYDFYNGKITNQWNPYNLTNLLYQHGETGDFSLPLGMNQSIIGDDYIVPLHSHNSINGRIALGLDPGVGWLPGIIPWFFPWLFPWLKKSVNVCGQCPQGQSLFCTCYYYHKKNPQGKQGEIVGELPVTTTELDYCHGLDGYELGIYECECKPTSTTPF